MSLRKACALALALLLTACATVDRENLVGNWQGRLSTPEGDMPMVFRFWQVDDLIACSIDSPEQESFAVPCGEVIIEGGSLRITVPNVGGEFRVAVDGDRMTGDWRQGGQAFDLEMKRVD